MRPPRERNASATDPDWQSTATWPCAVVGSGRPFQAAGPPGTKKPMQFGPRSAAPNSRARAASRSVVGLGGRPGLGAHARHHERANTGRRRFLERRLDALVVHHEERALGYLRQLGDARIAAQPCDLLAVRVDAPRRDAARDDGLDRGEVARRRADHGDRTGEEE